MTSIRGISSTKLTHLNHGLTVDFYHFVIFLRCVGEREWEEEGEGERVRERERGGGGGGERERERSKKEKVDGVIILMHTHTHVHTLTLKPGSQNDAKALRCGPINFVSGENIKFA